jgi:hypothetical protein
MVLKQANLNVVGLNEQFAGLLLSPVCYRP